MVDGLFCGAIKNPSNQTVCVRVLVRQRILTQEDTNLDRPIRLIASCGTASSLLGSEGLLG